MGCASSETSRLAAPSLPPGFFADVYSYISRIGSGVFLVVQVLVLLDFMFSLSEGLIDRAQRRDGALDAAGYEPGFCQNQWCVRMHSS